MIHDLVSVCNIHVVAADPHMLTIESLVQEGNFVYITVKIVLLKLTCFLMQVAVTFVEDSLLDGYRRN